MRFIIHLLVMLGIALGVGFALSYYALATPQYFGGYQYGPWSAWPEAGSPDPDPYTRAHLVRSGQLQLGRSEGIAFTASADSDGRPLTANCSYRLDGRTPVAAFWTLVATDSKQRNIAAHPTEIGLDSRHISREQDGSMVIHVSKSLAPGNWLEISTDGTFRLALTLYDASVFSGLGSEVSTMPAIIRERCAA